MSNRLRASGFNSANTSMYGWRFSAEVIVNYLASHVLLVYNESRQREIIQVYDHITRDLPRGQRREYSFNSTIPDDQCK